MKQIVVSLILMCAIITCLQAQDFTAGRLAEMCESVDNAPGSFSAGYCLGYLAGFSDANGLRAQLDEHNKKESDPLFCSPVGSTVDQARKVFLKYISDHPERLHESSKVVVTLALTAAFRCTN